MTTPTPAMDDSSTVPRPPGAVEAVLAAHEYQTFGTCLCRGWDADDDGSWDVMPYPDQHRAHVAQALVDAGCVLGDDWDVETRVEEGLLVPLGAIKPGEDALKANQVGVKSTRTVTTATRTTAWKEAE